MPDLPTPARLAAMYRRGKTYRHLATTYGVGERTIRRMLAGRVEPRRTGPPKAPPTDEEIIRLRDEDGLSWRALAAEVGMTSSGVRKRYAVATTGERPWRQDRGLARPDQESARS